MGLRPNRDQPVRINIFLSLALHHSVNPTHERYKHLISVPSLNFESILKRALRAVVEARVRWASPSRTTAPLCLVRMNHDGLLSVKFVPAHWKYRRSHESC
jgi:hypothetical protein